MVEFTVSKLTIEPCGTDVRLEINESVQTLIGQLCEDGREQEVIEAVVAWKTEQETES